LSVKLKRAFWRFRPTSSQPLDASCLKTQSTTDLKTEQTRFAFLAKLREGKGRAKDEDASNKSLDVSGLTLPFMKVVRFAATSIQPLGVS